MKTCVWCGYLKDDLDPKCPRCHDRPRTKNHISNSPSRSALTTTTAKAPTIPKNAVLFRRASENEITSYAEKELNDRLKQEGNSTASDGLAAAGCLPVVGCLGLFVPGIGIFVCIAGWLAGIGIWLYSSGAFVVSRVKSINPQQLDGLRYKWRNTMIGNCPICKSELRVMPTAEVSNFDCPSCSGPLHYEHEHVSPR